MFSMPTEPFGLFHFPALLKNPLLWLTALLLPLVPIATIFLPGAVTVKFIPVSWSKEIQVPTTASIIAERMMN